MTPIWDEGKNFHSVSILKKRTNYRSMLYSVQHIRKCTQGSGTEKGILMSLWSGWADPNHTSQLYRACTRHTAGFNQIIEMTIQPYLVQSTDGHWKDASKAMKESNLNTQMADKKGPVLPRLGSALNNKGNMQSGSQAFFVERISGVPYAWICPRNMFMVLKFITTAYVVPANELIGFLSASQRTGEG